jgi:hypothetical protein
MSTYQFERLQDGMFRVKNAAGYIGVVSGKSGDWRAETKRGMLADRFKTRELAAHALSDQRKD